MNLHSLPHGHVEVAASNDSLGHFEPGSDHEHLLVISFRSEQALRDALKHEVVVLDCWDKEVK